MTTPLPSRKPSSEPDDGFLAVGRVLRSWGLKGDLKVESLSDFPERFAVGNRLWLAGVERRIEASRWQKGVLYLRLRGIDDPESADVLRGHLLQVRERDAHQLEPDEFYHHDLLGLPVTTDDGTDLGAVHEVLETSGNTVLVIRGEVGETLLPFLDDVITNIDLAARQITVRLMEGLGPEKPTERPPRPPRRSRPARTRGA